MTSIHHTSIFFFCFCISSTFFLFWLLHLTSDLGVFVSFIHQGAVRLPQFGCSQFLLVSCHLHIHNLFNGFVCSPTHIQHSVESSFSGTDAEDEAGREPGTQERTRNRETEKKGQQQLALALFQEDCGFHEKMLSVLSIPC